MELDDTTDKYWDCECKEDYTHPEAQYTCEVCGACRDEQPDSIIYEVIQAGLPFDTTEMKVDLIASGYEWTCPVCEEFQHEIEVTEYMNCKSCGQKFSTYPPEHAYE